MTDLIRLIFDKHNRLFAEMSEEFYEDLVKALPNATVKEGVVQVQLGKAGSGKKLKDKAKVADRPANRPYTIFSVSDDPECYP